MSFTMITVTHGPIYNLDGSYASGEIVFRLTKRVTNGVQTYAQQVAAKAVLSATGTISISLPANNDPATVPADSQYVVAFLLNGANGQALPEDEYFVTVPYNAAGGTVDLGTLLPSQTGPSQTWMPSP